MTALDGVKAVGTVSGDSEVESWQFQLGALCVTGYMFITVGASGYTNLFE